MDKDNSLLGRIATSLSKDICAIFGLYEFAGQDKRHYWWALGYMSSAFIYHGGVLSGVFVTDSNMYQGNQGNFIGRRTMRNNQLSHMNLCPVSADQALPQPSCRPDFHLQ